MTDLTAAIMTAVTLIVCANVYAAMLGLLDPEPFDARSWAARNIRHAVAWVRRMVDYGHVSVALLVVTLALVAWWVGLVR